MGDFLGIALLVIGTMAAIVLIAALFLLGSTA